MKVSGYKVEAEWDGETLTARGTTKMGQIALRGQERRAGDVVLTRDEIDLVTFKPANSMVNGNLVVHAADGKQYQLHFRRKDHDAFEELASELGAVSPAEVRRDAAKEQPSPAPAQKPTATFGRQPISKVGRTDDGLRCPKCGGQQFTAKRSKKAKTLGVLTVGVGALAAPKSQVKCVTCGKMYRRG